jgi:hypothetical protein
VPIPHKIYAETDENQRENTRGFHAQLKRIGTMTHPQNEKHHPGRHLKEALAHADRLSRAGAAQRFTPSWSAQAAQVGDMSVLLLALCRSGS